MIATITEFLNQITEFVTSPDFQAFTTATIAVVTSVALLQNRLAALKVAKSDNAILKQNVEISSLEKMILSQSEEIKTLQAKLDLQSAMFASAFLNSKKLDAATKQELAKLATGLQKKKVEAKDTPIIEKVVEVAKKVVEAPVVETVEEVKSIYEKLTKV